MAFNNQFFKKNKYGAKRQKCNLEHSHASRGEAEYCFKLQMFKNQKIIKDFAYQKKYELRVNDKLIGGHKPDFTVERLDGNIEVHEYKGFETTDWHLRRNLFEAIFPEIPYITIKG